MAILIQREDYEFLLRSAKFCSKIDKYLPLLNLNMEGIYAYKNENALLNHVFNNPEQFSSCIESFTRFKIKTMRADFSMLAQLCKKSKNYTVDIGEDLGIEVPLLAFQAN